VSAPIDVRGLAKRWGPSSGLHPVTFAVAAGELVVVRGRSGSGKSTLLAVLAGWCVPDGGVAAIAGTERAATARARIVPWAEVAVVPQVLALVPELTVRENLQEACTDRNLVADLLDALDLLGVADRPPTQASMGQQQRAAVGRAAAARPVALLADEPTSHQDAEHGAAVVQVLRAAAGAGSAVLVASHDPDIAAAADLVVDLAS